MSSTSGTRGIRNSEASPARSFCDPAHLGRRQAKALHHSPLRPARAVSDGRPNEGSIGSADLGGDASLTVLHRPMLSHVHLVFPVSCPTQVASVVVAGVAVVVSDVRLIGRRRRQKGLGDKPVDQPSSGPSLFIPKQDDCVAPWMQRAGHQNRLVSAVAVGAAP